MTDSHKLWGGRFEGETSEQFARFNRSFGFDRRLLDADIRASHAHCNGLVGAGVLSEAEAGHIHRGLDGILKRVEEGPHYLDALDSEDVHSFVEARLLQLVGEPALKLHTGRSRNDQVATAFRLWLRDEIDGIAGLLRDVQRALVGLAEAHSGAVMPGYTHMQRAQPILFAHWCLAYFEMIERDRERMAEVRKRVNVCPLGSAALAGTSHSIDRESVARELGFESVSRNSLDAVSDRDFAIEFANASALVMMHLSRLAEDIIVYSTAEFGLIELSDAVATGSSLMPQKKNPDSMELVRGKAARVFGHASALAALLKGLPLAYNKDMQEDKEAVFDTADTVGDSLEVTATVLRNMRLKEERARASACQGYMNATELADYLVRKGMTFREAHETTGRIVLRAMELSCELGEMDLAKLTAFSERISEDVFEALSLDQTIRTKCCTGGTAPDRVAEAIRAARERLND